MLKIEQNEGYAFFSAQLVCGQSCVYLQELLKFQVIKACIGQFRICFNS